MKLQWKQSLSLYMFEDVHIHIFLECDVYKGRFDQYHHSTSIFDYFDMNFFNSTRNLLLYFFIESKKVNLAITEANYFQASCKILFNILLSR
jgi:hypothetical protein